MENTSIAIIGGGASGLIAALSLAERGLQDRIAVFERLDRVGKKLIATGNGQGNLYNAEDGAEHYRNGAFARAALARYGAESCAAFSGESRPRSSIAQSAESSCQTECASCSQPRRNTA